MIACLLFGPIFFILVETGSYQGVRIAPTAAILTHETN